MITLKTKKIFSVALLTTMIALVGNAQTMSNAQATNNVQATNNTQTTNNINNKKVVTNKATNKVTNKATKAEENKTVSTSQKKIEEEFDGLGGNGVLLEKAQALNPEVSTIVVQNRIVDRTNRFELSANISNSFGGDTYIKTGTYGLDGQFHFSNHWSVGAKYGVSFNKLTNEGDQMIARADADVIAHPQTSKAPIPQIDYPKSTALGFVNFYPIYGKISWLGQGISHFDIYGQLGYGQVTLESGATNAIEGGIGMSVWGTEHITTRLEMNYMDYTAQYYTGPIKMGITSASIQVGWLF